MVIITDSATKIFTKTANQLLNETMDKLTPEQLYQLLDVANIEYDVISHAPLMTVVDAKAIRTQHTATEGQIKNLFLQNKKKKMWLLTAHEDRKIDLKETAERLGAGRFSFCRPERLMDYLGVTPGAVSPFGLLNDRAGEVQFYIDETLLQHQYIYPHPFDNRATVTIKTKDLLDFLAHHGHQYGVLPR